MFPESRRCPEHRRTRIAVTLYQRLLRRISELFRFVEIGPRLSKILLLVISIPTVPVRRRIIGVQPDCLGEIPDRLDVIL